MKRVLGIAAAFVVTLFPHGVHGQSAGQWGSFSIYEYDLPSNGEYASRRAKVLSQLDEKDAMFVLSETEKMRSQDVEYDFRQRNNMLYLTGVNEQGDALLLLGKPIAYGTTQVSEIFFVGTRDRQTEIFEGAKMNVESAPAITGIRLALPMGKMRDLLDSLLPHIRMLYYDDWLHGFETEPLTGTSSFWDKEMLKAYSKTAPDLRVKDANEILGPMRAVKSPKEIELMRKAIDISLEGHRAMMRSAKPGMFEYELQAVMEYEFKRRGSEYPAYPSIVGSGPNSCVLHYSASRRQSNNGEVVLADCGAEYHGYTADVTRTFPVNGKFSTEQRAIYNLVYEAQVAGIAACMAGNSFGEPGKVATNIIANGLVTLGIIAQPSEVRRYFPHGTSHFLGLDVHDVGRMASLEPGNVLTVEPGIYIPEGSPCDKKWWNIGVRIEDDILVTMTGPENLSGKLARTADDIEKLMAEGKKADTRVGTN